ncbi:DUF397 domain-containing protein [Streptomyces sp. NBC_00986]|uniref:DUF397 domain-containing protein n=1 Tax=Streptomyces sp. NBC_00986 TaxID=2903702 RepID=UPI0038680B14|nr:DUF397 domain-containing protein [Streptomyces sp. NBC_00986]
MPRFVFVKSSHSGGDAGQECVEVARNNPTTIAVRDSKKPNGPLLHLTPSAWTMFTTHLRQANPNPA